METANAFDRLDISVGWRDTTSYGSMLSGRLQATVREHLYPRTSRLLATEMARAPRARTLYDAAELAGLVRAERSTPEHQAIVTDPAFWRHAPLEVEPVSVTLRALDTSSELHVAVDAERCRALRCELSGGCGSESDLSNALMRLMKPLRRQGSASQRAAAPKFEPLFVGHACVSWTDGTRRLWIDPFLRPKRRAYPEHFMPLSPFDVCEVQHAVLLTHAHPDHFDPGSLFWFPNDTQFFVPAVEHETPLTLRLDVRLRQLGFTAVRALDWYETVAIGAFEVTALPFYGEQPLGPEARPGARPGDRNAGNTYLVRGADGSSSLLLADSGADPAGSIVAESRQIRERCGPIDTLFTNHRRWRRTPTFAAFHSPSG